MSTPSSPPPGWHTDPEGRHQHRYHDGRSWTDDVSDQGKQSKDPYRGARPAPRPAPASPPRGGGGRKVAAWIGGGVVVLIIIGAIAGGGSSGSKSTSSSADSSSSASSPASSKSSSKKDSVKADCGYRATDRCTPHEPESGHVRVDALVWKILSARTTKTIGDQQYGLGTKAQGRFVVVRLKVHSTKTDSATLTDDVVKLTVNGNTYSTDSDGMVAAAGADEQPFLLDDIGPDSDRTGTVVFDVPEKVLAEGPELRFNELGFGQTHGYIRLPALS